MTALAVVTSLGGVILAGWAIGLVYSGCMLQFGDSWVSILQVSCPVW